MTELALKVIGAASWRLACGIITDAKKADADVAIQLKALADAQLAVLDCKADEARAG